MCGIVGTFFRSMIVMGCGLALTLQIVNTTSCRFVYKESELSGSSAVLSFGLYSVGYNGVCVDETHGYGSGEEGYGGDRILSHARMCNAVSMAAGGVAVFLVSTECMNRKIFCGNFMEGVALLIAWTTALAVYAMFGTEECGTKFMDSKLAAQLESATLDSTRALVELAAAVVNNNATAVLVNTAAAATAAASAPDDDGFGTGNHITEEPSFLHDIGAGMFNHSFNNHHLFDRISHDYNNATATMLFPEVFQHIPFGDTCNWGPGASYNIVAALLYFACGVLLCISPHSNPLFGGGDDDGEGRGRRRKKNKKRKSSKSDLSVALEYDCEDWYENHPNWTNLSETLPETTTKADLERELKLDEESASMHDWYEPEASPSAATATSRSSSSSSSKKTKKSSKKNKSKTNLSGSSIEITPDVNKVV